MRVDIVLKQEQGYLTEVSTLNLVNTIIRIGRQTTIIQNKSSACVIYKQNKAPLTESNKNVIDINKSHSKNKMDSTLLMLVIKNRIICSTNHKILLLYCYFYNV